MTRTTLSKLPLLSLLVATTCAFCPSTLKSRRPLHVLQRLPCCASTSSTARSSSLLSSEIFLLSFDGTVAQTREYRIDVGIDLAFAAWPHLNDLTVIAATDNHEWLRNKMRALSHILISRPHVSLSCDYALLARLLIEEQELDGARSNGSRGKYGSKFHPQTSANNNNSSNNNNNNKVSSEDSTRQTRPLTVGEIAANWNKGGCLGETVLTTYHVNYKNPLPILQDKLEVLITEKVLYRT